MGHPIYHLDLRIERCELRVRLNGVVLAELASTTDQPEWFAPPLNPYLIGTANEVTIEVTPLDGADPCNDFSLVGIDATVRRYEKAMPVAPGEGPVVRELPFFAALTDRIAQAKQRDEPLAVPQILTERFDNEVVSFAAELVEAPLLADLEAVKDYGVRLRDLLRSGAAGALGTELAGKVRAYAIAFDVPEAEMARSLADVLRDDYLGPGVQTDFERDDIELVASAAGRFCELRRPSSAPFIETEPDENGSRMQMPVVVGLFEGKLGVVR